MVDQPGPGRLPGRWSSSPAGGAGLYALVLLACGVLYAWTAQRGPAWQDSGIFQWRIRTFDLTGSMGLALAHPLLIVLGQAFAALPWGEMAWRLNLVSAAFGAIAAANVGLLTARLCPGRRWPAFLAAGLFALAHTSWWLATICESQMLYAAVFTLELNLLLWLVRRPRWWAAAVLAGANGLGWSVHNLALLALPAHLLTAGWLCAGRRLPWRALPAMLLAWLAGGALMLGLVLQEACRAGLGAAIHSALFGQSWQAAVLGLSPRAAGRGVGYVLLNFPNLGLPLAAAGLLGARRAMSRPLWWAGGYLGAVYLLFALRYAVSDQFMFFLPFYAWVAVLAGVGAAHAAAGPRRRWLAPAALASLVLAPALYAAGPWLWRRAGLPPPGRSDLAFRDPVRYWLVPWKCNEDSAGRFARAALAEVPPGGTIIADKTAYYPLRWVQQEQPGALARLRLLESGQAKLQTVPPGSPEVFVVSSLPGYRPQWLAERADLRRQDGKVLFSVFWHARGPPASGPGTSVP